MSTLDRLARPCASVGSELEASARHKSADLSRAALAVFLVEVDSDAACEHPNALEEYLSSETTSRDALADLLGEIA